ncbi:MAG: hypothetical protein OJF50_005070 [Nitrospira sp.]|jgi:hypothetical protein|nr:hypothetical protein [Nitrospira sp.]
MWMFEYRQGVKSFAAFFVEARRFMNSISGGLTGERSVAFADHDVIR